MNLKQIETFLKVMKLQNLTKVAKELQTTQPVISNIIRRMEKELDTQLFHRRGKTLVPSVQGKLFYEIAKSQSFSLNHMALRIAEGLTEKQDIIVASSVISDWFMRAAGRFAAENQDILITFQSEKYIPRNHRLASAEFMLLFSHELQDEEYLTIDYQDELYAVLPIDHPMGQRKLLSLTELKNEHFIFVRRNENEYERSYYACITSGFTPQIAMCMDNDISKYASIRHGCGIGLVFDNNLALPSELQDCTVIPIRGNTTGKPICLAWHEDRLTPAGRRFLHYIAKCDNKA
jgi:LysR family transcriptional activator of glutamate synthase operon